MAWAQTPNGEVKAQTIPVNGFFQGIVLPPETFDVRLQFSPIVRFAWIAHLGWLIMLSLLGREAWLGSRRLIAKPKEVFP